MITLSQRESGARRAGLFRGLGEQSRLSILEALVGGPRSVSEISELAGLSQPNTSNHLSCLLGCGLLAREQRGRFVYYHLADPNVASLLTLAEEIVAGEAPGETQCPHCGTRR